MIFRTSSIPKPSKGFMTSGPSMLVPDQSMSLKEILTRFVRSEALPVAHKTFYGSEMIDPESDSPLNVDLEKLRHADLTERDEYRAEAQAIKTKFEEADKAKKAQEAEAKKKKAQEDFEKRVEDEVKKRAKGGPDPKGSI